MLWQPTRGILQPNQHWRRGQGVVAVADMSIVTVKASPDKYITTTYSHTPTDVKKATLSYWFKWTNTGSLSTDNYIFTSSYTGVFFFDHKYDGTLHFVLNADGGPYTLTDQNFLAPDTNWHHVCVSIDTTQATASDRIVFYVDGVRSSGGSGGTSGTQPAQNSDVGLTANGQSSYISDINYLGDNSATNAKWAYVYLIDGQALAASSFTTGTGAGSIHPAAYAGTFGNNGFFLNGNGSTLTDQSGAGNNWTAPNGISFDSDIPT